MPDSTCCLPHYTVLCDGDRLAFQVDVGPPEPCYLAAPQPVERQHPQVSVATIMVEDAKYLLIGERAELLRVGRYPVNQPRNIAHDVALSLLVVEDRCQVEQVVAGTR